MFPLRLLIISFLLVASLAHPVISADEPSHLLQAVPASAPLVIHVRSLPELRANWENTPYARMWAEPEFRAFFAPTTKLLSGPDAPKMFAEFEARVGMAPAEFLALFPGEFLVVVLAPPDDAGGVPSIAFGAAVGENRAQIEAALLKIQKQRTAGDDETEVVEDFQGETIHVTLKRGGESGDAQEAGAWVMTDEVLWMGQPKAALQQLIANAKRGGADDAMTSGADFASIYQQEPRAQAAFFLNLGSVVKLVVEQFGANARAAKQAAELAATEDADALPPQSSMFEKMGLTPEVIVHATGLDALRAFHGTLTMDERAMAMTFGLTWSEQRGLLRLLAWGDAPAPQPHFVSPQWPSVMSARFKIPEVWAGFTESLRAANPMFEVMLAQQLANLKQQLGVDLERDFLGSFGDEVVQATLYPEAAGPVTIAGGEQLWAFSLVDADGLNRTLEAAWVMAPAAAQKFTHREHLGHQIHTISFPLPAAGGSAPMSLSYAVTPDHLFLDLGGASMIETAIQRLNGEGEDFWTQPDVIAALEDLPPGASSFAFQDLRRIAKATLVQMVQLARANPVPEMQSEGEGLELDEDGNPLPPRPATHANSRPGLEKFIDPDAAPSDEALARHLTTSTGAIYREGDGVRMIVRVNNPN